MQSSGPTVNSQNNYSFGGQRRRAYNLDDMAVAHVKENGEVGPGRLSQMTEGELGRHWSFLIL